MKNCDCGCNKPVATSPRGMSEFLAERFEYAGVSELVANDYARDIRNLLRKHCEIPQRAVYFESDWPENFGEEILVSPVRMEETDFDAIFRAKKLYGDDTHFYVKEYTGPKE